MPNHKHHCASCQYLGQDTPRTAEEASSKCYVDIYIHNGWRAGLGTFTRRWGADTKYTEVAITNAEGMQWEVVKAAAIKKGALSP